MSTTPNTPNLLNRCVAGADCTAVTAKVVTADLAERQGQPERAEQLRRAAFETRNDHLSGGDVR